MLNTSLKSGLTEGQDTSSLPEQAEALRRPSGQNFLIIGMAVSLAILVAVGWLMYAEMRAEIDADKRTTHTYVVMQELDRLFSALKDAETGERGFLLSGGERYLEPYKAGLAEAEHYLESLKILTRNEPRQQQRFVAIQALIRENLDELRRTVELRHSQGYQAALRVFAMGKGKIITDKIHLLVAEARAEEQQLLRERTIAKEAEIGRTIKVLAAGGALGLLLLAAVFLILKQENRRRLRAETEVRRQRDRLEKTVAERTAALAESEEQYRSFFQTKAVGTVQMGMDGRFIEVNERFCQLTGYSREELLQMTSSDLTHPDDREGKRDAVTAYLQGSTPTYEVVKRYVRKDGQVIWVHVTASLVRDAEGRPLRSVGVIQDITERKRAGEALRDSEKRFSTAFLNSPAALVITRLSDNRFVDANESFLRLTEYNRDEIIGQTSRELRLFQNPDERDELVALALRQGHIYNREIKARTKTGKQLHVILSSEVVDINRQQHLLTVLVDVTELRKTEEALHESEQRFRIALRNSPVSLAIQDRELRYVWAYNHRTIRPEELIGRLDSEIFTADEAAHLGALKRRVFAENVDIREQMWLDRPGGRAFVDVSFEPVRDRDGRVTGVATAAVDLTQLKLAEQAIQQTHRDLECAHKELEAFSYSVSHDLQAPLRTISGFARALVEDYAGKLDGQGADYLKRIWAGSEKMSVLIEDLLNLSRLSRQELQRVDYDLGKIAESVIYNLRQTTPDRTIEVTLPQGLRANVDPNLMKIALTNLLENAWKFTSKTEHPKIEFGVSENNCKRVFFVKDNGAGFDKAYSDRLFWPFRRLHSADEFPGTGIGLTIVDRIIRRHGGTICADGEVGNGAVFYFTLE